MTTLLLQQISESDDSEPDYLDELDKQEAALDEQLAAMSAEEDEEGDEEDEEWDEEDELLHPDQAIIEKLYKKGKVQRFLNDHEQARLDFLLQRWGLKAREILRSLDDVHDQPSWKLPYKFNAWYTGTNKPVLSFPFSLDRQWFEIVMAKRRQILEDNRSRFTYVNPQIRPGAVALTLAKNIQEDAPEPQDYHVVFAASFNTTFPGLYDTETEAAEKVDEACMQAKATTSIFHPKIQAKNGATASLWLTWMPWIEQARQTRLKGVSSSLN
jgi:hypothetical protein